MRIKKITKKIIEKIIKDKTSNANIFCACIEDIKQLPIGELSEIAFPIKLICGKLIDNKWRWISFPPDIADAVLHLFKIKRKFTTDKYIYFTIIKEDEHPLKIAKRYFVKNQDYEMAHQMREYIKNEERKKKEKDKTIKRGVVVDVNIAKEVYKTNNKKWRRK